MVGIPAVVHFRARALLPLGILLPAFLLAAACPVLSGPAAHAQEVAPARALRLSLYAARIGWTPGRPGTFGATLHRQGRLIAFGTVQLIVHVIDPDGRNKGLRSDNCDRAAV